MALKRAKKRTFGTQDEKNNASETVTTPAYKAASQHQLEYDIFQYGHVINDVKKIFGLTIIIIISYLIIWLSIENFNWL